MARAEITTPEIIADDSVVELSLRPQRLAEFIGQSKAKNNLRLAIDAALGRRETLDHILLSGSLTLERVWALPQAFSDHLPLAAEIRLAAPLAPRAHRLRR